ncbi:MAG: hypothetical protein P8N43_14655, partial [Alphaproteobacteria bacterium]|nr:hypothetical protein [Alphaproteobacteria bacterium]
MIKFLMNKLGLGGQENRRKYERYPIAAPLEVTVGENRFECEVENVFRRWVTVEPGARRRDW